MPPYSLLPLRSSEPSTQDYLAAKIRSYEVCLENECFDDAYVNAHLIFMYWLYCKLWVVVMAEQKLADRIFALHSFDSGFDRSKFLVTRSALELYNLRLEERKYAEVFGALCLDREDVKKLKKLVDDRNNILHPSGTIIFDSYDELERSLDVQRGLAEKIAPTVAGMYITLVRKTYGPISYRKLLKWEADYDLEQELFTKYHLSDIDFSAIKSLLHTS